MNKLEEALKKIENRIVALQVERDSLKQKLNNRQTMDVSSNYLGAQRNIVRLQEKAESIRKELNPATIVEELAIEQPAPRRGRRRTVNAE